MNQRKHQPLAATILAEENRPFRLHAIRTGQDRAESQSTPAKNFGLSDSSEQTSRKCCADPLNPQRLSETIRFARSQRQTRRNAQRWAVWLLRSRPASEGAWGLS